MNVREYIEGNYNELCEIAKRYTTDNIDLVNHCYLRCIDKEADNPKAYFMATMTRESRIGKFKEEYQYRSYDVKEQPQEDVAIETLIQKDRIDFHLINFDEFDREIYRLYREGENMSQFSKESGIHRNSITLALDRVKTYLKEHL